MNEHPTYLSGTYTVPAGGTVEINRVGNFVTCLDAPEPFRIRIGSAPETTFEKGLSFTSAVQFNHVSLVNPTGLPMEIQIGIGKGGIRDSRLIIAESSLEVVGQGPGGVITTQERQKALVSPEFDIPNPYAGVDSYGVASPQKGFLDFDGWDGVSPVTQPFIWLGPDPAIIHREVEILGVNKATGGNVRIFNEIEPNTRTRNNFIYLAAPGGGANASFELSGGGGWFIQNNLTSATLADTEFDVRIREFRYV